MPKTCRILESSGHAELDNGTCELMMQMRFEAAQDATGNPVPSHYSRPLVWLLTDPRPFASSRLTTQVRIKNHRLVECVVVDGEGPYLALWAAQACSLYRDIDYFFGAHASEDLSASIVVHLDAGDGAVLLSGPWPAGSLIAREKISFVVNGSGDATQCTSVESQNLGPRDLNNLSPCDRLLSSLWFKHAGGKRGTFETQVLLSGPAH